MNETKPRREDLSETDSKPELRSGEKPAPETKSGISSDPESLTRNSENDSKSSENGFSLIEFCDKKSNKIEKFGDRDSASRTGSSDKITGSRQPEVSSESFGTLKPEVTKDDEIVSIENLKEEIDQLLAPILTNQNEITQRIGLVQEDLLKLTDPDFRVSGKVDDFRSKRSPSAGVNHDVSEVIIESECQPRRSSEQV